MKTNMQSKRFTRRTLLTMGLIVGLIVIGSVIAYISKIQNLGGGARLVVENPTVGEGENEKPAELGIKFYKKDGTDITIAGLDFGNLREGVENTSTVIIRNTGDIETQIMVSGDYDYIREGETTKGKIETHKQSENGLDYSYGVYFPEDSSFSPEDISCSWDENEGLRYCDLITLETYEGQETQKEIEFFVKFPEQDTTGKSSTDIEFEYQFKLEEI